MLCKVNSVVGAVMIVASGWVLMVDSGLSLVDPRQYIISL